MIVYFFQERKRERERKRREMREERDRTERIERKIARENLAEAIIGMRKKICPYNQNKCTHRCANYVRGGVHNDYNNMWVVEYPRCRMWPKDE